MLTKQTNLTNDLANKRLLIDRGFDAPVARVWKAWTDSKVLDQWWAPKPYEARTKAMDFRPGGKWLYCMVGPDGVAHWCSLNYKTIEEGKSFSGRDAFCDEQGNLNTEMPQLDWLVSFVPEGDGTRVMVEITSDKEEDLHKILEMGFQEGFAMAHGNLDELLASGTV